MYIFDLVNNDNFFKPLASKNRYIYFDCIYELIKRSKGRPTLFDTDARDCLNIYLSNTQLEYVEETDDISQTSITKSGSDIMRYFRECGWLSEKELGRNGEYETHVTSYCRRVIEYLYSLVQGNREGALSNKILDMYDILNSTFIENSIRSDRPYTSVLKPLIDNMEDLKDELFDLKENIGKIMMMAMDLTNLKGFGDFLLKDQLLEKFFNDYFYIKNNGTIALVMGIIQDKLRDLSTDEWIDHIAHDYAKSKDVSIREAKEYVDASIADLRVFIHDEYADYMDQIESQINTYYGLAHAKLMLFSKSGMNLEAALDAFLRNIKTFDPSLQQSIMDRVSECMLIHSQKYVGTKSFLRKRRRKKEDQPVFEPFELSEQQIDDLTNAVIYNHNQYSYKAVTHYFDEKMKYRHHLELKNEAILTRYDALMYATAVTMTRNHDFKYDVKIMEDVIDFGFVRMSNLMITPKESVSHE